jgi:CrcB protein
MPDVPPPRAHSDPRPIAFGLELCLIGVGGAIGALARAAVAVLVPGPSGAVSVAPTQIVNLAGAFALGWLLAHLEARQPRPFLRPLLAVGLLGSFTTFSTLVDHGHRLASSSGAPLGLLFLTISFGLGLAAFGLGQWTFARLAARRERARMVAE